jgi:hypothetical protein
MSRIAMYFVNIVTSESFSYCYKYIYVKYENCINASEFSYSYFTQLWGAFCKLTPQAIT